MMKNMSKNELMQNYVDTFSLCNYFSPALLENLRLKQIEEGEYLVAQGSSLNNLFLLVDGKLQVEHFHQDGSYAVFSIEKAFSVIGDLELFLDIDLYTVSTVRAISKADIIEIPLGKIQQYGFNDPNFLRFICTHLSKKLYASTQLLTNVSLPAFVKVRKYLAIRAEAEGTVIQLEKRDSIAAMLGISTRQLNRVLKDLAELNIIQFKNKTVKVLDSDYLLEIKKTDFF
ncbi:helix-turn-helix domain-containing protein [Acinetobacter gyllenbergii]|uniref:Crp/Fnr family transcriptional regulator n=1 Tax=Acinetobacter gyllenbergii TaxID=134534 RepID=UPI0021D1A1F7|nr:cyclic nucleotide-binding domain-containing protein [Acinetobacter gyllenbergii]MCU4583157.1 helix-turn-helix domain-containing protein [Acinetobacter gyllenbergii]